MAFTVEAFQNRFLSPGQTRVDAILQVTAPPSASPTGGKLVVGFIVDKSGSMSAGRIEAVQKAVWRAVSMLDDRASFFVVAFDSSAQVVIPESQATTAAKHAAKGALHALTAGGGTAMSKGLALARQIFARKPDAIRQAVFLTDGKNEGEEPSAVEGELGKCEGAFQCDCWGVGTDWHVGEVQEIAHGLLGKASLIPDPAGIDAAFREAMAKATSRALRDVRLRLWTPRGAEVVFVKQVNPTIEDLTRKAKVVSAQVKEYLTGAWSGGEARDFHVTLDVKPGNVSDEMLAARPSLVYQAANPDGAEGWNDCEDKPAEGRVFANWTAESTLSSRIDDHVAHYTGQGELAKAIRLGLEEREKGNDAAATELLGRAVQLAHTSDNAEMTHRLAKVVDVVDPASGTVRLKRDVKRAATMDLELESRTTKRVARRRSGEGA